MNHPLLPVHLHDLPFFPFKRAPDDSHLVFFSHRNRSAVVLLLQLWRQRGGHDFTPLGRRRREVRFARFSPRRGHVRVKLHRGRSFVLVRRRFLVRVSSKSFDFCVSCARKSGQFITYSSFSISLIFVPSSFRVLNALFSFPLSLSQKLEKFSLSMSRFIFALLLTFIKTTTTSTTLTTRGHHGGARTTFSLSFFLSFFRFNVVGVIHARVKISKERERERERDVSSTVFLSLSLSLSLSEAFGKRGFVLDEYSGASSIFRARRLTLFFLSFSLHSKGVVVGVF